MNAVVLRAIRDAGLEGFFTRRLEGTLDEERLDAIARDADLLVLGAMADAVRAKEVGARVRLHVERPPADLERLALDPTAMGHASMREVARARLSAGRGAPVRVDAQIVGLPLAQLALAFGADEIVVPLRGLSLEVYGEGEQAVLREREIASLIRSAGREPIVVEWRGREAIERAVDETSAAKRRFRAPGREREASPAGEARREGEIG